MKKILTFVIFLSGVTVMADARSSMPVLPAPQPSQQLLEMLQGARSMGRDIYVNDADIHTATQAPAQVEAESTDAPDLGYVNPAGTMFLGMDESGKGTFFGAPGVIGGWSDSIPCWKWQNKRTAYKSIKYLTAFSEAYPQYCDGENYGIDKYGNFCDTILSSGGYQDAYAMDADGDAGYYWQHAVPHQTVKYEDNTEKTFMLLSSSLKPSAKNCPLAAGGLPSGNSSDGLWPLTNAVNVTKSGISMELIDNIAGDGYVSYLFGSSMYTTDSVAVPNVAQTADSMTYTRIRPVQLTTRYDKPQTPLYVKSVTLAVGSDKYSAFNQSDLKIDTLFLTIYSETGKELATSFATEKNLSNMSYKKGKLLTFLLQDTTSYGEVLREGLLLKDAFRLTITGFKESDNFGIYAAKCIVHPTKTEMLYEGGVPANLAWEPYIMLNGIYPTLEDFYATRGAETGQEGDTIPVNMISYGSSIYQYTAAYAKWGSTNDEFAFYSTFTPYDSLTRSWTMDIECPAYIQMSADYEHNLGDEDDPITFWMYYRLFTMHIYATETPKIGDFIKIGKAGKYIYFRIDAINGKQDIEDVYSSANAKVEKFVRNGQVLIRKNGQVYNCVGQKL